MPWRGVSRSSRSVLGAHSPGSAGLQFVGPFPGEPQSYITYVAAPMSTATLEEGADAFITFLLTPMAKQLFAVNGVD